MLETISAHLNIHGNVDAPHMVEKKVISNVVLCKGDREIKLDWF